MMNIPLVISLKLGDKTPKDMSVIVLVSGKWLDFSYDAAAAGIASAVDSELPCSSYQWCLSC